MPPNRNKPTPRPLDQDGVLRLALHYVGRYATTEAKLGGYLRRKVRERGWDDDAAPDFDVVVARCAASGYVDDASFAEVRAGVLNRRGYGARRIGQVLQQAGVDRALVESVMPDKDAAIAAAETYARRKRIGSFAITPPNESIRRRHLLAMIRAGHSFELARKFAFAFPSDQRLIIPD
jgi:regulatory protein